MGSAEIEGADVAITDLHPAPERNEGATEMGKNVNLVKLEEQLERKPIDEIASLVRSLTYGEMIELAEAIWNLQPDGSAISQDNLSALLHRWSTSRVS
jgi:hypothetical protein